MDGDYMGNQLNQAIINKQEETKSLPSDMLLAALYFFWDGFERASMNFFLVKDTALQVKEEKELSGDKLTFGIRKMEWQGGADRVFKAYMEHEKILPIKKDKHLLVFNYKSIPIYLYIYEENPCLSSFNIVFYKYETFNLPNPFEEFCKTYDKYD